MPQLRPQGNSPNRHALLRDEVSKMWYTNGKVITGDFSRGNSVEDYFQKKMSAKKDAFEQHLKKGVDT